MVFLKKGLTMHLRIISDTHNEFRNVPLILPKMDNEKEQILVIAGDFITLKKISDYKDVLISYSNRFKNVLYVLGNHEYYGFKLDLFRVHNLFESLKLPDNFHLLTRLSPKLIIDNIQFVGSTLWTDFDRKSFIEYAVGQGMNDFKKIIYVENKYGSTHYSKFKTRNWFAEFVKDFEFIKTSVSESTALKTVVITHHAPSLKSVDTRYQQDKDMNHAYCSNLEDYLSSEHNIKIWIHGHIHQPKDYMVGNVRVLSYPYGYKGEFGADETQIEKLKFVIEI